MSDFPSLQSFQTEIVPGKVRSMDADATLDLRGTPCPINFVRTKLKLAKMPAGALLEVWLDGGEPMEQVPDSLRMEGYDIEAILERPDCFALHVRKPA